MKSEERAQLEGLRTEVLKGLVEVSDYMASDKDTSYDVLLMLARTTQNTSLLSKAFEKVKEIEDQKQRGDAMLDLLDEIELTLANAYSPESPPQSPRVENREQRQPESAGPDERQGHLPVQNNEQQ